MRRHVYAIATLLLLATAVQTLVAWRAIVPAQDAVRFVALAQRIESGDAREVWRESGEAAFATLVAAIHRLKSWEPWATATGMNDATWATCAQVAAAIPAVLLIVPVYVLFTLWLGRRSALLGSILFCLCPSVACLAADGLCDSTHLLLAVGCLALAVAYLRRLTSLSPGSRSSALVDALLVVACGMLWAAAVLVRPESLVLAPAIWAAVALACWFHAPRFAIPSRPLKKSGATAGLSSSASISPEYTAGQASSGTRFSSTSLFQQAARVAVSLGCFAMAAVGVFAFQAMFTEASSTPLAKAARMLRPDQAPRPDALDDDVADDWRLASGQQMAFPFKEHTTTSRFHGLVPAAGELLAELPQALGWAMLPLAATAMWWHRRRWRRPAEFLQWTVLVLVVCASTLYAASAGYLSSRHLLLAVVPLAGWSGWGCRMACRVAANKMAFVQRDAASTWSVIARIAIRPRVVAVLFGITAFAMIDTPLHGSRIAHRRAALWLDHTDRAAGAVLDTRGWTMLYSDRPTYRYDEAPRALLDPELAYVVVEQRDLDFDSPRGRTLREVLARGGTRAAVLPGPRGQPGKAVLVYRWQAARFAPSVVEVLAN